MRNDDNKDHYLNSKSQDWYNSREYWIIFLLIKMSLERDEITEFSHPLSHRSLLFGWGWSGHSREVGGSNWNDINSLSFVCPPPGLSVWVKKIIRISELTKWKADYELSIKNCAIYRLLLAEKFCSGKT